MIGNPDPARPGMKDSPLETRDSISGADIIAAKGTRSPSGSFVPRLTESCAAATRASVIADFGNGATD